MMTKKLLLIGLMTSASGSCWGMNYAIQPNSFVDFGEATEEEMLEYKGCDEASEEDVRKYGSIQVDEYEENQEELKGKFLGEEGDVPDKLREDNSQFDGEQVDSENEEEWDSFDPLDSEIIEQREQDLESLSSYVDIMEQKEFDFVVCLKIKLQDMLTNLGWWTVEEWSEAKSECDGYIAELISSPARSNASSPLHGSEYNYLEDFSDQNSEDNADDLLDKPVNRGKYDESLSDDEIPDFKQLAIDRYARLLKK